MALKKINSEIQYTALSTDIVANAIVGLSNAGAVVFISDTAEWKLVLDDLTLADYFEPVTLNGSISIGVVEGQGIAGTPSGGIVSIQGESGMTPVAVSKSTTSVAPTAQASTSSFVLVTGSILDTINNLALSYTIQDSGAQSIDWQVIAGNVSNLSDATVVNGPATILTTVFSSYSTDTTPFRYYGVQIRDTVGGVHGQATVHGITKC